MSARDGLRRGDRAVSGPSGSAPREWPAPEPERIGIDAAAVGGARASFASLVGTESGAPAVPRVQRDRRVGALRSPALLGLALVGLTGSACVPGRCEGGFRMLLPDGEPAPVVVSADAAFWINADASDRSAEALLADSGVDATTFVLVGPSGPVAADLSAASVTSAHSCASAATFHLKPRASLPAGEYTLVLRLDRVKWPALLSGEVGTFEGERALVRRYVVR